MDLRRFMGPCLICIRPFFLGCIQDLFFALRATFMRTASPLGQGGTSGGF